MLLLLLFGLATVSNGQVLRCDTLMTRYTCPYGGKWVKWQQTWSGFQPPNRADATYNATYADEFYYYDKAWPQKMGDGLDVKVTPPGCTANEVGKRDGNNQLYCYNDCRDGNIPQSNPLEPLRCPYTKYDITHNQIKDDSDGKTRNFMPGGFRYGVLAIYNQPPVCVCIDNSYDRQVELAIETLTPNAKVCVLDATKADTNSNQNPGEVSDCDEGRFYKCFPAQTDHDLIFRIYCDSGCEDENVQLFYRARMSPYRWTVTGNGKDQGSNPTEMWCDYLPGEVPTRPGANRMQYPLDIADVVPDNYKYRKDGSAASHVGVSSFVVALGALVTTLLCL